MYMRIILIVYSNYKSIFETYYLWELSFVFIKYFEIFSPFFPETNLIKLLKFIKLSTITSLHLKQI